MRQQTILMKYHTLFLLQNSSSAAVMIGALRVKVWKPNYKKGVEQDWTGHFR